MSSTFASTVSEVLRPGMTVALGDGAGTLCRLDDGTEVFAELGKAAREVGAVRLLLGWLPRPPQGLDPNAFSEVITLMPGWGMRGVLRSPTARFLPYSVAAWPALLTGTLRPDLLITRLVKRGRYLQFGSEVSYQNAIANAGIALLGIVDEKTPDACALPPLESEQVRIVGHSSEGPIPVPHKAPEKIHDALADAVLRFVPEGARLQYGPGQLGTALLRRAKLPLQIDTGLLTDAVIDLERHGLLVGVPSATYLIGTDELYEWAAGRPILRGIEHTHDLTRLSRGEPFVAVNTAIEIDRLGQINVEGIGDNIVGGIGGHPDYCAAGRMSRGGLSIIAVPSSTNGRSPLVEQLSRPVSTPAHDIDLIVTESGHADLRGADWTMRQKLIAELFGA